MVACSAARPSRAPCGRSPTATENRPPGVGRNSEAHCATSADYAEFIIGPAKGRTQWVIRPTALIEVHHLKRGAAKRAVWIVKRLADLEMIVVLGHDETDGLAAGFEGGGEFPGLALEFRRFQGAI